MDLHPDTAPADSFGVLGHRTFHGRKGRLSPRRRDELDSIGPRFVFAEPILASAWSDEPGVRVLEIGSGMGDATVALAQARPHENVLACEVHTAGVANLCRLLAETNIDNVRVLAGDGCDALLVIRDRSLTEIRAYFPDPWPKRGQRHRRLIQPSIVALMAAKLAAGGMLSLATDDPGYASQMDHVCGDETCLSGGVVRRPGWRPMTKYERKASAAGRVVVDLSYTREP